MKELLEKRNKLVHKPEKLNKEDLELISEEIFQGDILHELTTYLKVKKDDLVSKIKNLLNVWLDVKQNFSQKVYYFSDDFRSDLYKNAQNYKDVKFITSKISGVDQKSVQSISSNVMKYSDNTIAMFYNEDNKGIYVTGMVSADAVEKTNINMGKYVKQLTGAYQGRGGGTNVYGSGFVPKNYATTDQLMKDTQKHFFGEENEEV